MAAVIINKRYHILNELGQGGMGRVYLVEDALNQRQKLVLKTLKADYPKQNTLYTFKQEFELMTRLHHPHLLKVYDFEYDSNTGEYYITMEYLKGRSLNHVLCNPCDDLDEDTRVEIMISLLRGVEFIHSRKILHRDIKPANILVGKHAVKLMDFGLADLEEKSSNRLRGTIAYMAPEVIKGQSDTCIDIFSLGITFFELFTKVPYYALDKTNHILADLKDKKRFNHKQEEMLERLTDDGARIIIKKMTAFDKEARYHDCISIIKDINRYFNRDFTIESDETKYSYVLGASFIGREKELQALKDMIDDSQKKVFVVYGEPGIGKSRLCFEYRKYCQLNDLVFISGNCYENYIALYSPFISILNICLSRALPELIMRYGSEIKKLLPDHRALSDVDIAEELNPQVERSNTIRTIVNFIIEYIQMEKSKVVFFINDIHWMDEASAEVRQHLQMKVAGLDAEYLTHFAILLSSREEGLEKLGDKSKVTIIQLTPFKEKNIGNYMHAVFGENRISRALKKSASFINHKVGGNPFYLQELIKSLVENDIIKREGVIWDVTGPIEKSEIPETLNELFTLRFQKLNLSPGELRLLEIMSLLNRKITIEELSLIIDFNYRTLSGLVELELCKKEFDKYCYYYSISHALSRQFIVNRIEDKKTLHEVIAVKLEEMHKTSLGTYIDELAYHYANSGNKNKAEEYVTKAAEEAFKNNSGKKALELYTSLLIYIGEDQLERINMILEKKIRLYLQLNKWDEVKRLIDDMIGNAVQDSDNHYLAKAYYYRGVVEQSLYNAKESIEALKKSTQYYQACEDYDGIMECYSLIGVNYASHFQDTENAVVYINRSIELAGRSTSMVKKLTCFANSGIVFFYMGRFNTAINYLTQSLDISRTLKDKKSVALSAGYLGIAYKYIKEYKKALEFLNLSVTIAEEIESDEYFTYYGAYLAELLFILHYIKDAQILNDRAFEVAMQLEYQESIFSCKLLGNKIDYHQTRNKQVFVELEKMIKESTKDNEIALLHFELWKIRGQENDRHEALRLYRSLYEKGGNMLYKMQIDELCNRDVEPKPSGKPGTYRHFYE